MSLEEVWNSVLSNEDWVEILKEQSSEMSTDEQVTFAMEFLRLYLERTDKTAGLAEFFEYLEELQAEYTEYIEWRELIVQYSKKKLFLYYLDNYTDRYEDWDIQLFDLLRTAYRESEARFILILEWMTVMFAERQIAEYFVQGIIDSGNSSKEAEDMLFLLMRVYEISSADFDYEPDSIVGKWLREDV